MQSNPPARLEAAQRPMVLCVACAYEIALHELTRRTGHVPGTRWLEHVQAHVRHTCLPIPEPSEAA